MARKLYLLAIILAILISVGYARAPKKILKGEDASIIEVPHQVSLRDATEVHLCGGSIIDPLLILTAAHCIIDENENPIEDDIYVVFGTNDEKLVTPYNFYLVVRRVHHDFDSDYWTNDIAILKVNRPIFFSGFVAPANLPLRDVQAGTIVMASGWGATTYNLSTQEGGNFPRFLKKHYGTVITRDQCQKAMGNKFTIGPEHICIETPNGADTCDGDSGGPLTYNGEVIGITSFGVGCGLKYPSVFTRVHHYLQWIRVVQWTMLYNSQLPPLPDFVEA